MKLKTIIIGLSSILSLSAQCSDFNKDICVRNKQYCETICSSSDGSKTNNCSELDLNFECACNKSSSLLAEYYSSFPAIYEVCYKNLTVCFDNCDDGICLMECSKAYICIYKDIYNGNVTHLFESTQVKNSDTPVNSPKLAEGSATQSRQQIFIY
ncbi:hypothetical protein CONCODRAFT_69272 [Conidiobolus coronatus NRRL 28638]|uniref:DUF7707 domain-containing protein n=1 Tax=Conidiobolus coronatus (strain ATCC 28846 / CBS 209.66 / NRRL 28638) TaxID=796925 RepID=A0A137PAZ9_CONC2|nr:hypothetical protein CONCODRAFT_69272 [Conidiobolus coronatus NRRL 28638]|eukprot:KXN72156.1 hypothetical protein CONCODRAFT_69272 [Conidiobolus coronatus NRRL 28638]